MITWEAERRFEEQVESKEREREISPVPGLSWNSWKWTSKVQGEGDLTSSWALMEQLKNEQAESMERDISPVPGLSWHSWKMNRLSPGRGRERSNQFLGSHGTAENEQVKSREREREISPVPGLSWNSWNMNRLRPGRGRERSPQFLGSHGTAEKWTGWVQGEG